MKKTFIFIIILVILWPTKVYADEKKDGPGQDVYNKQVNSIDTKDIEQFISELNRNTPDYLPKLDFKSLLDVFKTGKINYNIKDMLLGLLKYLFNDVLLNTKLLSQLVLLAIICAVLENLENAFNNDAVSNLAYYACYLVLIIIVVKSFTIAVSIGRDTINRMVDFMLALLPTLLTLIVSVGGFTSASIFDPIIMFTVQVISNIVRDFILPIIFLTAVLSIVNNLSNTFQVNKLAGLLKQVCVWTLGFILTIFIGIITIRSTTGQTIDQVTAKTLKFAVDNFIPIVGKALSDAVSTVAGYSLVLKDAISTVGLLVLVITCIFPLLKIISMIFIYKVASALIEPISDKRIVNCLNDVGNSLTMIFACITCVAVMFFIMVTIIASTGKMAVMSS